MKKNHEVQLRIKTQSHPSNNINESLILFRRCLSFLIIRDVERYILYCTISCRRKYPECTMSASFFNDG